MRQENIHCHALFVGIVTKSVLSLEPSCSFVPIWSFASVAYSCRPQSLVAQMDRLSDSQCALALNSFCICVLLFVKSQKLVFSFIPGLALPENNPTYFRQFMAIHETLSTWPQMSIQLGLWIIHYQIFPCIYSNNNNNNKSKQGQNIPVLSCSF